MLKLCWNHFGAILGPFWDHGGAILAKMAPSWPKVPPGWSQDGPTWPQDAPKMVSTKPKMVLSLRRRAYFVKTCPQNETWILKEDDKPISQNLHGAYARAPFLDLYDPKLAPL